MEKVLGIIAEYNPFHNGHLYHLKESKKKCGATSAVAIVSGNFTQRGEPSIFDKWSKAKVALENGVDLVIELPLIYSISSAENFAEGAIKILDSLEVIDFLSFGAENADINMLSKIATVLYEEPKEYRDFLSAEIKSGISFPKARANALTSYLGGSDNIEKVISSPNNILAIEYLKALKKYESPIMPIAIARNGAFHNDIIASNVLHSNNVEIPDTAIPDEANATDYTASSSAIRKIIKNYKMLGDSKIELNEVKKLVPETCFDVLKQKIDSEQVVCGLSQFEQIIIYNLRKMKITEIAELADVSEGLEFAIKKAANSCNTLDSLINMVKSKRYTYTRIQRILLYSLLGITKKDISISKKVVPYVRVLGFNENGKALLSKIASRKPKLKIITSVKDFINDCIDPHLAHLLEDDIFATNVYSIAYKTGSLANLDFTEKLIVS